MVVKNIFKKIYDLLASWKLVKTNIIAYGNRSVDTDATLIMAAVSTRTAFIVQNISTQDVYIGGSSVTTSNGIKLEPGDSYSNDVWLGAVYGRVAAGSSNVRYEQFY